MDGSGKLDLLHRQIAVRVLCELLAENQNAVERRTQLMRHVGQEFRLVLRGQGKFRRLLFQRAPGLLDFLVLPLHLDVAFGQLLRLLLELFVGLLQFLLLGLQFAGELLRLLQQTFGLHRRLDTVEHDTDAVSELFEKGQLRSRERTDRRELDDGLDLVLEQDRKHHKILRPDAQQRRIDRNRIGRDVRDQPLTFVHGALPDQALAKLHELRVRVGSVAGIGRQQTQLRTVFIFDLVDHAHMGIHQRRQLGQEQPAHGGEVALALQHVGKLCEVGLQPVLFGVHVGGQTQVADHGVDVVFELGHFAARIDLNRAGEVALGDGGGNLGDGAHLGGEVGGQQVDVVGEILPGAADAGHHGLAAEASLGADFTRHARHFGGERAQLLDHGVQRILEQQDLAADVDRDLFRQVAAGDRGRDLGDVADLCGQV